MPAARKTTTPNRFETFTDWNGYLKYLDAAASSRVRITYDRGRLELMSPYREHERMKKLIGGLVETLLDALGIEYEGGGSVTTRRQGLDRGVEPDECYWIEHCPQMSGRSTFDAEVDPPPDLVLEIDITSNCLDRLDIYRVLGVPEVWRWRRKKGLDILCLGTDGKYHASDSSRAIPQAPLDLIREAIAVGLQSNVGRARAQFRRWLHTRQDV